MNDAQERTFEIGLTMAGAVSAGAYTAGVVDFLLEALSTWYDARARGEASIPSHSVSLRVMSGASAGALTAAIVAANARVAFPPVKPGTDATSGPKNPLFTAWVDRIDMSELLKTRDLASGAQPLSLLDTTIIDQIADEVLTPPAGQAPGTSRPYFASTLRTLMTVTNITGVPYAYKSVGAGSYQQGMTAHGDVMRFAVTNAGQVPALAPRTAPGWTYEYQLDLANAPPLLLLLKQCAIASAAFPLGLKPRELTRDRTDYNNRPVVLPGANAGQLPSVVYFQPNWPTGSTPDIKPAYNFVNFDGGCIDNEPFELARTELAGGPLERNERSGSSAARAVIIVDPFPQIAPPPPLELAKDVPLQLALFKLLGVYKDQARFKPEELALALQDDVYSRFLIAPVRPDPSPTGGPDNPATLGPWIASGALGGFSGFLSREYRRHDYWLGRRNCQQFLRRFFTLKEDNPLFAAWRNEPWAAAYRVSNTVNGVTWTELPVIPLMTSVRDEEPVPKWPFGVFDPASIRDAVSNRANAIFQRWMEGESFLSKIAKFAWWTWGRSALTDKILNAIRSGLATQRLVTPKT